MSKAPKNLVVRRSGPVSYDETENTVDIVYSTGARRDTGTYWETLVVSEEAIDTTRLDLGAEFLLVDHYPNAYALGRVISHRIEDGQAVATVQLSEADYDSGFVTDIKSGVIRQVSVGYEQLAFEDSEVDGVRERLVTRWMPWEFQSSRYPPTRRPTSAHPERSHTGDRR